MRTFLGLFLVTMLATACGEKLDPLTNGDSGVDDPVTYTGTIRAILESSCTSCHASTREGADRRGAPVGIDFDSYEAAKASAERANAQVQAGTMPPSQALSDEDKALFQVWLDTGLQE